MRFQARHFSNTTSLWPEGRRAAISSSVRFADSHSRNSARNRSTSAGYEKSTLLGGSFIDFASTLQRLTADCGQAGLYGGADIWSTSLTAGTSVHPVITAQLVRLTAATPDSTLEQIFGQRGPGGSEVGRGRRRS